MKKEKPVIRLRAIFGIVSLVLWCMPAISEGACGAAASSCKNCHEVKGEHRVNGKGNHHIQHAFGDFCAFCHSGNTAGTTKGEAHEGLVNPQENLEQSCASCHPDDYAERGKKYGFAVKTGTPPGGAGPGTVGAGSGAGTVPGGRAGGAAGPGKSAAGGETGWILPPTPDPAAVAAGDLIDYNLYWVQQKKNRIPGTPGDRILVLLSLLLALGFPALSWIFGKERRRKRPREVVQEVKHVQGKSLDKGIA